MKTLKKDGLIWIALLAPFVFIAIYWDQFPEQIPTHFGLDGKPDDYGGKAFGLLLLPLLNLGMYFFFLVIPKIDPSRAKFALFLDKFRIIRLILHLFFCFVFFLVAVYSLGVAFNLSTVLLYGMLVLFLLLGNYMGTVRHNYFVGVRTPWTLANETVWTKTHRLTGKLWVFSSLAMMVLLPFVSNPDYIFLPYLLLITIIPVAYSYIEFRKLTRHEN